MSRSLPAAPHRGRALGPAQLAEIVRHAESGYPDEVCGLVLGTRGAAARAVVRPLRNVADAERPADPAGVPRGARTAYLMDPLEELHVLREADASGWDVLCIYHSHPDHEPSFSPMDRDRALDQAGRPLWPGVLYLVVSVRAGLAGAARGYRWSAQARTFVGTAVPLPERA